MPSPLRPIGLPTMPYVLPDGTVLRTAEDAEIAQDLIRQQLDRLRARKDELKPAGWSPELQAVYDELPRWGLATVHLQLLLRVHGHKYDKWQAHNLLAEALEALSRHDEHAELVMRIDAYLQPRLARHPEALAEVAL